ncbi:MAG: hypothetical protein DRG66_00055 [Deltaproteobacteria bacterium]|nr:MAG: hypothetical protein DRG66_00055 [Deltaproteobacteria bacterium]
MAPNLRNILSFPFFILQLGVYGLSVIPLLAGLVTFNGYRRRHFSKPVYANRTPKRAAQPFGLELMAERPQPFDEYFQGSKKKFLYNQLDVL